MQLSALELSEVFILAVNAPKALPSGFRGHSKPKHFFIMIVIAISWHCLKIQLEGPQRKRNFQCCLSVFQSSATSLQRHLIKIAGSIT